MSRTATRACADAMLAARMCGVDPALGGMVLRGDGGLRDEVVAALAAALPPDPPVRRLPVNATEEQIDHGLDLAAALAGREVRRRTGLLAGTGLLIAPLAERMSPRIAAAIAAALDSGGVSAVAALEDGDAEVGTPSVVADRLAFRIDLDAALPAADEQDASARPIGDLAAHELLATTAAALGVASLRADLLAMRAARAAAALAGRTALDEADLAHAVRLVLAPRATRLPAPPEAPAPAPAQRDTERDGTNEDAGGEARELEDRVLAAARAAIDPDLVARLESGAGRRGAAPRGRGAGERRRSLARGRPIGTRAGSPRGGARLALVETLRAAAPWQGLRGRTDRILVRRQDLRIYRHEARAELVTIFAVDASGSAAMARLGEAKGAVELLLGQAYVQRAEVALTAFRGTGAELLLPPTRSLTRARRALAELPGGGGTPLAGGIEAARLLAVAARARGRTPMIVLLSDGRGNITAGGVAAGRAAAERDAIAAARALAADGIAAIFVDTGARARPEGERIAREMGARYLPLPYAGAEALTAAVSAFAPASS